MENENKSEGEKQEKKNKQKKQAVKRLPFPKQVDTRNKAVTLNPTRKMRSQEASWTLENVSVKLLMIELLLRVINFLIYIYVHMIHLL